MYESQIDHAEGRMKDAGATVARLDARQAALAEETTALKAEHRAAHEAYAAAIAAGTDETESSAKVDELRKRIGGAKSARRMVVTQLEKAIEEFEKAEKKYFEAWSALAGSVLPSVESSMHASWEKFARDRRLFLEVKTAYESHHEVFPTAENAGWDKMNEISLPLGIDVRSLYRPVGTGLGRASVETLRRLAAPTAQVVRLQSSHHRKAAK